MNAEGYRDILGIVEGANEEKASWLNFLKPYPEGVSAHRRERLTGAFYRILTVPMQIDVDGIKAGPAAACLLFISCAESDTPRTIRID